VSANDSVEDCNPTDELFGLVDQGSAIFGTDTSFYSFSGDRIFAIKGNLCRQRY